MAEDKKVKATKRPTALKRQMQSERRRVQNKQSRSQIRSAIRNFEESMESGDKSRIKESLNAVYSLVDKAVKSGIYKLNKAARTKSRLTAKAHAKLA